MIRQVHFQWKTATSANLRPIVYGCLCGRRDRIWTAQRFDISIHLSWDSFTSPDTMQLIGKLMWVECFQSAHPHHFGIIRSDAGAYLDKLQRYMRGFCPFRLYKFLYRFTTFLSGTVTMLIMLCSKTCVILFWNWTGYIMWYIYVLELNASRLASECYALILN